MSNQDQPAETPRPNSVTACTTKLECLKCKKPIEDLQQYTALLSCNHIVCNTCWLLHLRKEFTEIKVFTCPVSSTCMYYNIQYLSHSTGYVSHYGDYIVLTIWTLRNSWFKPWMDGPHILSI